MLLITSLVPKIGDIQTLRLGQFGLAVSGKWYNTLLVFRAKTLFVKFLL